MLLSLNSLVDYGIQTLDGPLGHARDYLFDDRSWHVRYVVVDTGRILPGRGVLLAPASFGQPDWESRKLPVNHTREEVKAAPSVASDRPVSQQEEEALHAYYQWAPYWAPGFPVAAPFIEPGAAETDNAGAATREENHLRSFKEVRGYHLHARDGEIGHVEDFILDDETWDLRMTIVETRNWLPGKLVPLAMHSLTRIDWETRSAAADLTRDQIQNGPEFDPSAPVNKELETRLYDYYGRPQ